MLKNTFIHIQGVGAITEQRLWEQGIRNWEAFDQSDSSGMSGKQSEAIRAFLAESRRQLEEENPRYFADRLPANLQWRLFPEFRKSTVYLDIETTGMDAYGHDITVIGLFDGTHVSYYIKDRNLNEFADAIRRYKVIVTYNGKCFDIPFIRSQMGLPMNHAHIDLRYVLAGLGYRGGLKGCEKAVGIDRGELAGLDGYDAVLLWHDYEQNGNEDALNTLLAYNGQDVINLEALMVLAYNRNLMKTPFFSTNRLCDPLSDRPSDPLSTTPFQADPKTVQRMHALKRRIFFEYGH
jgi:uncharacterized protein YprB with RNaseH-like and TPR domain